MRALSAADLLDVWERGLAQPPAQRALLLLAAAYPTTPLEALAEVPIGQRDADLLTLREWAFGSQLVSVATCPACGATVELSFAVADIRVPPAEYPPATLVLEVNDYAVQFRLPTTRDLLAVGSAGPAARLALLARCVVQARHHDDNIEAARLPPAVVEAVSARMAQLDPQADVQLALACPACDQTWHEVFDILAFFWTEIHTWAGRLLREVHTLAQAYGWREAEILALSPPRRQLYLEMVSG